MTGTVHAIARRTALRYIAWPALAMAGWQAAAPAAHAVPADARSQAAMAGTTSTRWPGGTVTLFPAQGTQQAVLSVDSSTDTVLFAPAIRDFQRRHPGVAVRYADRQSLVMHASALRRARGGALSSGPDDANPDLLISSSLDLQTLLANDGYVLPHRSAQTRALPEGAQWRDEVFSLGADPVVMVYHPRLLPPARAPQTRGQLLALLRDPDQPLMGRIGTYDATRSGLGYLLATQDARYDSTAGVLLAAMGANRVRLGDYIEPLLDELEAGRLALVYNVPASYVQARIAAGSPLRMVVAQDYTLLTTRAAVIPAAAARADLARSFLDDLLSPEGQAVLARDTRLLPIRQAVAAGRDGRAMAHLAHSAAGEGAPASAWGADGTAGASAWRLLAPGLGLLVYLDPLKRRRFLQAWASSMGTVPGGGPGAER